MTAARAVHERLQRARARLAHTRTRTRTHTHDTHTQTQGFLPESLDAFAENVLYPAYSPQIGIFLACSSAYGLWKVRGVYFCFC